MSSSNVSSVTNHFPTANEGFITTLGSTILSGATTVPLTTTSGLTNGTVFVGIVEPGTVGKEQTFTGTVDTAGNQITGVKWTRGTNTGHNAGVTVVDYVSGTGNNMFTKGLLVSHDQAGTLNTTARTNTVLITPRITTSINDSNGNEVIKTPATASAVNEITITNAATGNSPILSATGGDTNIGITLTPKGTGAVKVNTNPVWQYLGSATYTGGTVTSSGATPTLVTSLTTQVTIPSGCTAVKITVQLQNLYLQTGAALGTVYVFSGATSGALTTQIQGVNANVGASGSGFGVVIPSVVAVVASPSAGAIYYSAAISASGSNAKTDSSATAPAQIIVECC